MSSCNIIISPGPVKEKLEMLKTPQIMQKTVQNTGQQHNHQVTGTRLLSLEQALTQSTVI